MDDSKVEHIHLFYTVDETCPSVFCNCKRLKTCVIMGQRVESLDGIEELKYLEELWIVDACLKQENIQPLYGCTKLKKLFLYGNELTEIPNLNQAVKLATIWLSDNRIHSLQNLNNLTNTTELNLSNNNIGTIDIKLKTTLNLALLSLAGNPIFSLKEILKLSVLRRLQSLVLNDPLYGSCPVTLMANYRKYMIYNFPELKTLDLISIHDSERKAVKEAFNSKCQFYRMSYQHSLARHDAALKSALQSVTEEHEMVWHALHHHGPTDSKYGEKDSNLKFWEAEYPRWKERKAICLSQFQQIEKVRKTMLQKELEFSGNFEFEEIDIKQTSYHGDIKKTLNSFLCLYLKRRLTDVNILDVWKIQGHHLTEIYQSEFQDSWDNLYLLCSVQNICTQPLEFLEEFFFGQKETKKNKVAPSAAGQEVSVSNCLATADPLISDSSSVHRQLLLRSSSLLNSRLAILCGVRASDDTTNGSCSLPNHSPGCRFLVLSESSALVPLYLIHFKYIFQDYFKPLKEMKKLASNCLSVSSMVSLPAPVHNSVSSQLTSLTLSNSNLCGLDIPLMETVLYLDLSFNQIQDISSILKTFPKLSSLNLAFNKMRTLDSLQTLKSLENINLKWNLLHSFQNAVYKLKQLTCLKHLDLSWNPFVDVLARDHKQVFVYRHLSSLQSYNGHSLSRALHAAGVVTLSTNCQIPLVTAKRSPCNKLTLGCKSEWSGVEHNHLGVSKNQVVSATLTHVKLTQLRSVFSVSKLKWLDLSHNLISSAAVLKNLTVLEQVNLSHNVLETFSCPSDQFKYLTWLDLSHNYLTTMKNFHTPSFPNLKLLDLSGNRLGSLEGLSGLKCLEELYLNHNCLEDMKTLVNVKPAKCLQILDLSFNSLAQSDSFRHACIYFLPNLRFLNGSKIRDAEVKSSISLYGGTLDPDYLLRVYSAGSLQNLTHLTLADCSLKTVALSDVSLPNVSVVTMDHNKLSCLYWVKMFPRLTHLNLSHNQVSYWDKPLPHPSPPHHHPSLLSLVLDHNHLRNLGPLCLEYFPNMTTLVLNNNDISILAGLRGNTRLQRLVLDRNCLSYIRLEQLDKLSKLKELYLEHNSLSKLDFIPALRNLQTLFVGFNKLAVKAAVAPLHELPLLAELTVHGNPLFRTAKSYRDSLPELPSLRLLEGHPVNRNIS